MTDGTDACGACTGGRAGRFVCCLFNRLIIVYPKTIMQPNTIVTIGLIDNNVRIITTAKIEFVTALRIAPNAFK